MSKLEERVEELEVWVDHVESQGDIPNAFREIKRMIYDIMERAERPVETTLEEITCEGFQEITIASSDGDDVPVEQVIRLILEHLHLKLRTASRVEEEPHG